MPWQIQSAHTIGVARLDGDQPERRSREHPLGGQCHGCMVGDDAESSWSKAEDAIRHEQCRQKGRQQVSDSDATDVTTSPNSDAEALKALVRRNTEQVQGQGDFALFDELFADEFVDHTPQPGTAPNKAGVRVLYHRLRDAFPDFRPEIHWQTVDGDIVTTFKIYHGTHRGEFLGIAPTGKTIQFETVDAMRVRDGKITDHWGVANLYSVLQQLGQLPPA
jgi:steroid delta-isomerase-like uncharacterized protein